MNRNLLLLLFAISIFSTSCEKNEVPVVVNEIIADTVEEEKLSEEPSVEENPEEPVFSGSITAIENFYSVELVESLQELGFLLNTGDTPPNINGTYFISPFVLEASTVPTDTVGNIFVDQTLTFSNQNNEALTIDFQIEGGDQITVGNGSFITGNDNNFSVFLISQSRTGESVLVDTAVSLTGQIDSLGIRNLRWAGLMLDDKGDPDDLYIPNNSGRLIYDSDKLSPLESNVEGKKIPRTLRAAF